MDTAGAAEELSTASEYQRKAGRRTACLGFVIIVVITVVLIAVGHRSLHAPHTVLTFPPDFIVVGDCGYVIIDDSYYGSNGFGLLFSYNTHQLRADTQRGSRRAVSTITTHVTVANDSDQ